MQQFIRDNVVWEEGSYLTTGQLVRNYKELVNESAESKSIINEAEQYFGVKAGLIPKWLWNGWSNVKLKMCTKLVINQKGLFDLFVEKCVKQMDGDNLSCGQLWREYNSLRKEKNKPLDTKKYRFIGWVRERFKDECDQSGNVIVGYEYQKCDDVWEIESRCAVTREQFLQ